MPEFYSGAKKTANIFMRNPKTAGFEYAVSLYMGTDLAEMSKILFRLEAGQEKQVSFPVTMPSVLGTYPVHIGVFSGGENIALYRAEDVILLRIVTQYALSLVSLQKRVSAGAMFPATVHVEIPPSELYPVPTQGGKVVEVVFGIHAGLLSEIAIPGTVVESGFNGYKVSVGAYNMELKELRTIGAWEWHDKPLPAGVYNLMMRLVRDWYEYVPELFTTYGNREYPLGGLRQYGTIEVV